MLGPPVCVNCMLEARLANGEWHCSGCGDKKLPNHLFNLDHSTREIIESNMLFIRPIWNAIEVLKNEKNKD
jgi:hypothetical protein